MNVKTIRSLSPIIPLGCTTLTSFFEGISVLCSRRSLVIFGPTFLYSKAKIMVSFAMEGVSVRRWSRTEILVWGRQKSQAQGHPGGS